MALMSSEGWLFLLRWIHFLAGITWIGLLYYLNFAQVPFFAETEPGVRSGAQQKLLPRVMWWFRWGAKITFLSGWIYLLHYWLGLRGINDPGTWKILLGGLLGSIMWANVWFVIWPRNKIVIQNALDTAAGKPAKWRPFAADPATVRPAARAARSDRRRSGHRRRSRDRPPARRRRSAGRCAGEGPARGRRSRESRAGGGRRAGCARRLLPRRRARRCHCPRDGR